MRLAAIFGLRLIAAIAWVAIAAGPASAVDVELEDHDATTGVQVRHDGNMLQVDWSDGPKRPLQVVFDLSGQGPLLQTFRIGKEAKTKPTAAGFSGLDPALYLTIGTRERPRGGSPLFPDWAFFDNPAKRPHQTHRSKLDLKSVVVSSRGKRTVVRIGDLQAGSFRGAWEFTFYADSPLVKMEAVASSDEPGLAIVYDIGLVGFKDAGLKIAWPSIHRSEWNSTIGSEKEDEADVGALRLRVVDDRNVGSLAMFPPPHQFFFPRDYTDNLAIIWCGRNHAGFGDPYGIGVRQMPTGGGNWVPWCNAPPRTMQRFGAFLMLTPKHATAAIREAAKYTNDDRFPSMPGHTTFTSHYHMAVAEQAMRRTEEGKKTEIPEFVQVFKDMGVQMVHLGEFHGDGHPKDLGPLRLPEMEMMFRECRRLSDDELLFIPGEEINEYLGKAEVGKHPGHWMSLFPRPVYWTQKREEGQPFIVEDPKYGKIYRVGSREDMERLIAAEGALVWSAHPRIKASSWAPDEFKDEAFFRDASWLGGAFKAMPADLSEPRLGRRCLDLLDDMSNWGAKKYLPGEVDVFKINRSHELYGHMNVNYLRLDRIPKYDEGWQPVLDVLQRGAFFTTTGEMLIHDFRVGDKQSGETVAAKNDGETDVTFELSWTFPPEFAEIISGDGTRVFRERIDLTGETEFGRKKFVRRLDLRNRRWVRLEAWDTAVNGAYSQPVWVEFEDVATKVDKM